MGSFSKIVVTEHETRGLEGRGGFLMVLDKCVI